MKKVYLDLDDGSILRSRYDLLDKLHEHFPKLKLSLFWIPYDLEYETSLFKIQRKEMVERIRENLDWIELIPHGLMHIEKEFLNVDRQLMKDTLRAIDEAMQKDGLPYVKGFKAPYWLWNQSVIDVLDEEGWFGAVDRNQPGMLRTKKVYEYTHSIDEPFWLSNKRILKLHGHMRPPSSNNLEDCLFNLLKMENDWDYHFVSELMEGKK